MNYIHVHSYRIETVLEVLLISPELSRYFLCRIIMLSYLTYIERIHKMLLSLVPTQAVLPVCWDLCEVLGMAEGTF